MRRWLIGTLLGWTLACVTAVETGPAGLDETQLLKSRPVQGWTIHAGGRIAGSIVRLEPWSDPTRFHYVVRNVHNQDLGLIDELGRAFRFRPHVAQPDWVGSGTVAQGAQRILELDGSAEVREVPLEDLEARVAADQSGPQPANHRRD